MEKIYGLLVYDAADLGRAGSYIEWLQSEANAHDLSLRLVTAETLRKVGAGEEQFAINRSRSYDLALLLELWGLRVFNPSELALLGNDKLAGYRYAQRRGLPFAPLPSGAWQGNAILSKPVFGHGGEGVCLYDKLDPSDGRERLQQTYVAAALGDLRFYILANEVLHTVLRRAPKGALTANYSLGGSCAQFSPDAAQLSMVYRLIEGMQVDYAGADFLLLPDGSLLFNELEDAVGSRMLSQLGLNDTTPRLMAHIRKVMDP